MNLLLSLAAVVSFLVLNAQTGCNFPQPLPKKEEAELFLRMSDEGDSRARERLIEHNLRLVAHIVRKYYPGRDCQDDLISVGTIGLIKAVDTFNIKKGARFATYGAKCIQNEILMYFRSMKKTTQDVSINETIDTDRDGNPLTYMDIIRCEDTIADDIFRKMQTIKAMDAVNSRLEERERQILYMRYGLYGNEALTQRETAQRLGISRSYVSRIEKCALKKIRESL